MDVEQADDVGPRPGPRVRHISRRPDHRLQRAEPRGKGRLCHPALLYALGVLIFAVGLLLSIALHEIGHMVPAKKFGVKVTQYMVGFGPTLFSRKQG